jgi:hypothetical protein
MRCLPRRASFVLCNFFPNRFVNSNISPLDTDPEEETLCPE